MNIMKEPDERMDLTGVLCLDAMTRALMKLEGMESGSILEIVIDDGEPTENIPPEIVEEGHEILSTTKQKDQWRVLIRRA